MKPYEKISINFKNFLEAKGQEAYKNLKIFFDAQKQEFYNDKIAELQNNGVDKQEAVIKARQAWVSVVGRALELVIEILIQDFCHKHNIKTTNDKTLRSKKLSGELDSVKRALLVHFGEYSLLPDGDIILYKIKPQIKVLAILSIKNSFRERYTETPYWKLKLKESTLTQHIKVFMITPDNDDEISFCENPKKPRIVMEYELDGIYLAKSEFDSSSKIKGIESLVQDFERLL
ncbi:BsaWI family type II restriction enzyme [Helicobacter equorum]|uniref:Endonuclease n=1 Tax=Helicobacter equorum TaxID=361872 RepID=A0A3D8IRQ7_9HELI|nr:BsaWI family type II restriction enzyme [Helicobacter equorum]RDU67978.1 endonuclease [Helicobacter equorum]